MSPAEHVDVRWQGFVRGVALVSLTPKTLDVAMIQRQARYWSMEQVNAWGRWTRLGMDLYLLVLVLAGGLFVWLALETDHQWWGLGISVMSLLPLLASWYRSRRGWL